MEVNVVGMNNEKGKVIALKECTESISGDKWWSFLEDVESFLNKEKIPFKLGRGSSNLMREANFIMKSNKSALKVRRVIFAKFLNLS